MQLNEKSLRRREKHRQHSKLELPGACLGERCIPSFKGTFPCQRYSDGLGVVTLWPRSVHCRDRQSSLHQQVEITTLSKLTQPRSLRPGEDWALLGKGTRNNFSGWAVISVNETCGISTEVQEQLKTFVSQNQSTVLEGWKKMKTEKSWKWNGNGIINLLNKHISKIH